MKKVEKVDILELIASLNYIYNNGYDFIDLSIIKNKEGGPDIIRMLVRDEYITEKTDEEDQQNQEKASVPKFSGRIFNPLNDDDINTLS